MDRLKQLHHFLKQCGLEQASLSWLPTDASFRHYARLNDTKRSYILMDAPAPEIPEQFALIDKLLLKNGLSAPLIYQQDFKNGFLLLEDFGNDTYTRLLAQGENEESLYKLALDSLFEIQKIKDFDGVPHYDEKWLKYGLSAFLDWFIPMALPEPLPIKATQDFYQMWIELYKEAMKSPQGLILIDYHIDNMIRLPGRPGCKACGLLDFQDAKIGPFAYDLVSLLEDARRNVPSSIRQKMRTYYLQKGVVGDKDIFEKAYHILAAKRHTRVIGVFTRLKARDHKNQYLCHIPRVWKLLESHLNEPYLKSLKDWLDIYIPSEYRKVPSCLQTST